MHRGILENLRRSLSAEKHMCLVLALQARQSPNTQDQAGCLKAATGHLFEVTSLHLVLRRKSPCEVCRKCHPKTAEHHFVDRQ